MSNNIRIHIDQEALNELNSRYGENLVRRATGLVQKYGEKLARSAKQIIKDKGYIDTGRLRNSIHASTHIYAGRITGKVQAGAKYARFIHEGAKHTSDTSLTSFFVPFRVAPSLLKWALRRRVIVKSGDHYMLMTGKNPGQHINIETGGLRVKIHATKFFETPFEELKPKFLVEAGDLINEE